MGQTPVCRARETIAHSTSDSWFSKSRIQIPCPQAPRRIRQSTSVATNRNSSTTSTRCSTLNRRPHSGLGHVGRASSSGHLSQPQPKGFWLTPAGLLEGARALVRDRGTHFIETFDEIFSTEGLKILKTPVRTPVANSFAERWIGSTRRELLDRTIIWNQQQLERIVIDYINHYNTHRPHRSLNQQPPLGTNAPPRVDQRHLRPAKSSRCDGLIHEYRNAA
ncbi:MAG: integrase core domain-containing protein [Acidimicrobiales bacterium]